MAKSVENIKIYNVYIDFISYIEMITEKYPKHAKEGIVVTIKNNLYIGMENILKAYKVFKVEDKLYYLNELDINLKMLKVLGRVSYKKKYISMKNYEAWSRKINNIGICLGGWINVCRNQ